MGKKPVYYSQLDKRWADVDYSAPGETTDIKESGCGPTAAAMLIETISGETFTPVDACNFALRGGYKAPHQGTYYSYFEPQFADHGIYCKMLNYTNTYGLTNHPNHERAFEHLRKGGYVIAVAGPGIFTRGGHFLCVYDVDDNYVYINDPASTAENRSKCDRKTFKSQMKYYWLVGETSNKTENNIASKGGNTVMVELPIIKNGSKGDSVKALQILLNGLGYSCGSVDCSCGPKTVAAIKAFQKANDLKVDGYCGQATWSALLAGD